MSDSNTANTTMWLQEQEKDEADSLLQLADELDFPDDVHDEVLEVDLDFLPISPSPNVFDDQIMTASFISSSSPTNCPTNSPSSANSLPSLWASSPQPSYIDEQPKSPQPQPTNHNQCNSAEADEDIYALFPMSVLRLKRNEFNAWKKKHNIQLDSATSKRVTRIRRKVCQPGYARKSRLNAFKRTKTQAEENKILRQKVKELTDVHQAAMQRIQILEQQLALMQR